jgi:GLPGLI family protein
MKIILLSFLFFCLTSSYSQNKTNLSIRYSSTLINLENYTDSNKKEFVIQMKKYIEEVAYDLKVSGNTSEFATVKKMTLSNKYPNPIQATKNKTKFYIDSIIFIEEINAFDEYYLIEEPSHNINWKLINDTKTILGYICYKATFTKTGDNNTKIDAWYAPTLPFQFGPNGYHGLPGLILMVIQNNEYVYIAESINWSDDVFVIKPTSGEKITRKYFNDKVRQAFKTIQSYNKN